jgi:hypothetical protein
MNERPITGPITGTRADQANTERTRHDSITDETPGQSQSQHRTRHTQARAITPAPPSEGGARVWTTPGPGEDPLAQWREPESDDRYKITDTIKTTTEPGAVGTSVGALDADETPRVWDWVLVVVYLVLSLLTVLSLVDTPALPRDCVSLQSAFRVADLHLCGPVPQSSPSPEVGR